MLQASQRRGAEGCRRLSASCSPESCSQAQLPGSTLSVSGAEEPTQPEPGRSSATREVKPLLDHSQPR